VPEEDAEDRELKELFARRVRQLAEKRGVLITHVADFGGVSRAQFFKILSGECSASLRQIGRIARALDVSPSELLRED